MTSRGLVLFCLWVACPLRGTEGLAPAPDSAAAAAAALEDEDVYYAPEDEDAAGEAPGSMAGSLVSRAEIQVFDVATGAALPDAELFLGGAFIGRSPLTLDGRLLEKPLLSLAARREGCEDALRPAVALPVEGVVRVAMVRESSARWFSAPAWSVGLGLLAASAFVYDSHNTAPGLALLGGGVGVIALSQLMARLVYLPRLRRKAEAYNAALEPLPAVAP